MHPVLWTFGLRFLESLNPTLLVKRNQAKVEQEMGKEVGHGRLEDYCRLRFYLSFVFAFCFSIGN